MSVHSFRRRPLPSGQARAGDARIPDTGPAGVSTRVAADMAAELAGVSDARDALPEAPGFDAPTLCEAFAAHPLDGAAGAFVMAMLPPGGAVLWAQDRLSRREAGAPYLPSAPFSGRPLLRADLSRATDVLAALEDGLSSPALAAVVGEIHGDAPSFTATRRLALRAERWGRPCWLILHGSAPQPSAARLRWRLSCAPSAAHPHDPLAPGAPRWKAELFRARGRPPATWIVSNNAAAGGLTFAPLPDAGFPGTGDIPAISGARAHASA